MKKFLALTLSLIIVLSTMLASCAQPDLNKGEFTTTDRGAAGDGSSDVITDANGDTTDGDTDNEIKLNGIDGKTAAELLLTQLRLDENALGADLFSDKTDNKLENRIDYPKLDYLASSGEKYDFQYLGSETIYDAESGQFVIDGNKWEWSDLQDYSDDISFYLSYINNIKNNAKQFSDLIKTIKSQVNITDKWLGTDVNAMKMLLTVGESSETIFVKSNSQLEICEHSVDESGNSIYKMFIFSKHDDGNEAKIYMKCIGDSYYEFAFDYDPGDDLSRYNAMRIIVENTRGYWNMLCLNGIPANEYSARRFNLGNLVAKDDIVYQVQIDMMPGVSLEESTYMATIISPDWKNDIVYFGTTNDMFSIGASAVDGIESIKIDDVTNMNGFNSMVETQEYYGGVVAYNCYGGDVKAVLSNGMVLKEGDTFSSGISYYAGQVRFNYNYDNPDESSYYGALEFRQNKFDNLGDADAIADAIFGLTDELGLTFKYDEQLILDTMKEASQFTKTFGKYYKWNGHSIEDTELFWDANDDYVLLYNDFFAMYEDVKDLPFVDINNYLEPLPEELDFADFSAFVYGNITIEGGVITADEMVATVPDNVLFDDGREYVLRLGLRKYLKDGATPSEIIVALHGDDENFSKYVPGNAVVFNQGSAYTIPANLSEGKYLLVAYVSTADEGIRISKTVPIASVDFTSGTVDSVSMDITYEKVEDDKLVVSSVSKLYLEYVLPEADEKYTYEKITELMSYEAMVHGAVAEDAIIEGYSFETKEAYDVDITLDLVEGTYRLKYSSAAHDGADAYIYCVVTEDMLVDESETESETESESESISKAESDTDSDGETDTNT